MSYVGAPYNFVPLSSQVYGKKENDQIPQNVLDPNLKSGKIQYELEAVTPIFVSDGRKEEGKGEEFYRDSYGRLAVPGSTLRGLVRSNVQILSCSSAREDIQNERLMYREIASGKSKKYYNSVLGGTKQLTLVGKNGIRVNVSVLEKVKAGYIRCKNEKYQIIPAAVDPVDRQSEEMNYYALSERLILDGGDKGFACLRNSGFLQHRPKRYGSSFEKKQKSPNAKRVQYKGWKNEQYHPYEKTVYYQLKGDAGKRAIAEIVLPGDEKQALPKGFKRGRLFSTGPMEMKKILYVIPDLHEDEKGIELSPEDIENYRRDYERKKNQIEAMDKQFFRLPENGETRAVFYVKEGRRIYFGYTPHLRLFYDYEIHDGLGGEQRKEQLDYAKLLFGYAGQEGGYKSRISFSDALAEEGSWKRMGKESMILGNPKPTSYYDYLESSDGRAASYNDKGFKLRGIKQYWLKNQINHDDSLEDKEKVKTSFHPLDKGTIFRGEIRFSNLREEELGMLLWGLLLEEHSQQNIGKGKPFGYGRVKVRLKALKVLDLNQLYGTGSLCLDPYQDKTEKEKEGYIAKAKEEMADFLKAGGIGQITELPGFKELFLMKDSREVLPEEKTRYMRLGGKSEDKEYQNRIRDESKLPTVEEVIKGKQAAGEYRDKKGR